MYTKVERLEGAEPSVLLADLRFLLSAHPYLAGYPVRLAERLGADEETVRHCLEVLRDAGEVAAE